MNTINDHHDSLEPQRAFVALFDVLGFKSRLKEQGLATVLNTYRELAQIKVHASRLPVFSEREVFHHRIGTTIFSDTILLWCDDTWDALETIVCTSAYFIAAATDAGWPLRGGLAYGDCVIDRLTRTFIGQPIIDAYETEQSQDWIGASLHQSVLDHPLFGAQIVKHEDIIEYKVPIKEDRHTLDYALHWCPYGQRSRVSIGKMKASLTNHDLAYYYDNSLKYVLGTCSEYHSAQA